MVVTGDRDTFQLVERRRARDGHRPRDHRHQDLRPRCGDRPLRHPAGADPRLLRAEGRHLGQHPRRPRASATRPPPSCSSDSATWRRVLASVDEISGAKRKENLTNHAEDARISQAAGHLDPRRAGRRRPRRLARARARPLAPARDLPRVRAARPAAAPRGGAGRRATRPRRRIEPSATAHGPRARGRAGRAGRRSTASWRRWRRSARSRTRTSCRAWPRRSRCASPPTPAATRCWSGEARRTSAEVLAGWGEQARGGARLEDASRVGRSDPSSGAAAARARHDGGRLPDRPRPARLSARRAGRGARASAPRWRAATTAGRARRAHARAGRAPARAVLEELGLTRLLDEVELPLVDVLVEMERAGVKLDVDTVRDDRRAGGARRPTRSSARSGTLAGEEFTIGSPAAARARSCSSKLGLSKKRRGKTGFSTDARVLQAIRSRARDHPQDRDVARADQAQAHLPRRLPRAARRRRAAAHHLQPGHRRHRPAVEHQPQPPEHPDPHRAAGARSAPASWPRRATG